MERQIDFSRVRHLLCGSCGHRWLVDLDWIERWKQGREECPGCRMTCEHGIGPGGRSPDDSALDDDKVRVFRTTPVRSLTAEARLSTLLRHHGRPTTRRRDGRGVIDGSPPWAARQRAKALHVAPTRPGSTTLLRRSTTRPDLDIQFSPVPSSLSGRRSRCETAGSSTPSNFARSWCWTRFAPYRGRCRSLPQLSRRPRWAVPGVAGADRERPAGRRPASFIPGTTLGPRSVAALGIDTVTVAQRRRAPRFLHWPPSPSSSA